MLAIALVIGVPLLLFGLFIYYGRRKGSVGGTTPSNDAPVMPENASHEKMTLRTKEECRASVLGEELGRDSLEITAALRRDALERVVRRGADPTVARVQLVVLVLHATAHPFRSFHPPQVAAKFVEGLMRSVVPRADRTLIASALERVGPRYTEAVRSLDAHLPLFFQDGFRVFLGSLNLPEGDVLNDPLLQFQIAGLWGSTAIEMSRLCKDIKQSTHLTAD